MSIWQTAVLIAMASLAIGCLLGIWRAIEKLAKGIFSIAAELTKMGAKLQKIEAVNGEEDSFEAMEAAFANFERLKRIDATKPQG